jgi:hypothetical protein
MGSNTNFDPTGEKKARKQATLGGAIVCGVSSAVLGALLGMIILATSAPAEYKPKANAKTSTVAPPPAGLFYWAGVPTGDYQSKETQFLASQPGLTLSDGELNAWATANFKSTVGIPKPKDKAAQNASDKKPQTEVEKAKAVVAKEVKVAEQDLKTWGLAAGTPNFHAFKDPAAPADAPVAFQVALPMAITLFGVEFDTVYQARGVFVSGPAGPQFKPYYSYLGSARIPVLPGLAQKIFNTLSASFARNDALRKYADAWAKYPSVTVQDGALILGGK